MPKLIDLTGQRFGRLLVLSPIPTGGHMMWLCRCDCGVEKAFNGKNMRNGISKSCGCLRSDYLRSDERRKLVTTHGKTATREFRTWSGMKTRCLNQDDPAYPNYGGRGITVCQEWIDSFWAFIDHVGPSPSSSHSIDRIDNNKGYEPGNVRWATSREQNNNRRSNKMVEYQGRTQTLTQWGRELGIKLSLLYSRSKLGWDAERMFERPASRGWKEGDPGSPNKHIKATV